MNPLTTALKRLNIGGQDMTKKSEQKSGDYEERLAAEQEAQRKAAVEGTESPNPAEGVRADKAEEEVPEDK